jgi:SAM-dependent methyltransferase
MSGGDHLDRSGARAFYDGYYVAGASEWREVGALPKAANIVGLCRHVPRRTLLDVGSGDGAVLSELSRLHFAGEMRALEISTSAVDAIRGREIADLVDVGLFDGTHIPYDRQSFDLVTMSHVLEHVEDPRALIREAARVGRRVFVEVPLEDTLRLRCDSSFGHINYFRLETIVSLLETSGLSVAAYEVTNPGLSYLYRGKRARNEIRRLALRLAPRAARHLFTYHCALLCESKD